MGIPRRATAARSTRGLGERNRPIYLKRDWPPRECTAGDCGDTDLQIRGPTPAVEVRLSRTQSCPSSPSNNARSEHLDTEDELVFYCPECAELGFGD